MSDVIKIDLKRSGFPVKIGSVELWFDSSFENLKNFMNMQDIALEKIEAIREKAKHIHFPEDLDESNIKADDVNNAFSLNSEFIALQYDIIFGDGAFKKVYEVHPDIIALEDALEIVGIAITERINELEDDRLKSLEQTKKDFIKKKMKKRQ